MCIFPGKLFPLSHIKSSISSTHIFNLVEVKFFCAHQTTYLEQGQNTTLKDRRDQKLLMETKPNKKLKIWAKVHPKSSPSEMKSQEQRDNETWAE